MTVIHVSFRSQTELGRSVKRTSACKAGWRVKKLVKKLRGAGQTLRLEDAFGGQPTSAVKPGW